MPNLTARPCVGCNQMKMFPTGWLGPQGPHRPATNTGYNWSLALAQPATTANIMTARQQWETSQHNGYSGGVEESGRFN